MNICETLRRDKLKLINSYNSGKSVNDIGGEYNCDPNMVCYILKEFGIKLRGPRRYSKGAEERYYCLIKHMSNVSGLSIAKISKILHISKHFILKIFKSPEIDYSDRKYFIDKKTEKIIIKLYTQGFVMEDIAHKFNISSSSVMRVLTRNNINTRHSKRYSFKEDIVDNGINTPELAWMFGLWLSDGNCFDLGIKIGMCDKDVIEKLKIIFETTSPIRLLTKENPKHKNMYLLSICSKELADKFTKLGCMPNKTHILTFPKHIPKHLISHFIRGVWDGDGSISKKDATVTGTRSFIEGIRDISIEILGLKKEDFRLYVSHPTKTPNNTIVSLFTANIKTTKIFLDWLYLDSYSLIRMDRKYIKYMTEWKNRDTSKRKTRKKLSITGNDIREESPFEEIN